MKVVVKDAALGIASGVSQVFPWAEQRDDSFHGLYELGKVRQLLERRAYGAITAEQKAFTKLRKIRVKHKTQRQAARKRLEQAQQQCESFVENFDRFDAAAQSSHRCVAMG